MLLLSLSLVTAATITPQKGLNLRNTYNITNVGHIDSSEYCIGLDCKTAWWNLGDYWPEKLTGLLSNVNRISFNKTANYTGAQEGDLY